jgi:hypothetical protein
MLLQAQGYAYQAVFLFQNQPSTLQGPQVEGSYPPQFRYPATGLPSLHVQLPAGLFVKPNHKLACAVRP